MLHISKKFLEKRIGAFILVLCMLLATCSINVFAAADNEPEPAKECAEISFEGGIVTTKNIAGYYFGDAGEFVTSTAGGITAMRTDIGSRAYFIYGDIDAKFMNDVPEGTPVEATIKYFDAAEGFFTFDYGNRKKDNYNGIYSGFDYFVFSQQIFMEGSQTWKTITLRFTDFAAAETMSGSDFRLAVWTVPNRKTTKDVTFASVKIEYGDYYYPIMLSDATSKYQGNYFSADEETSVNITMSNKFNDAAEAECKITVRNSDGLAVNETIHNLEFVANETKNMVLPFENPKIHGTYLVDIEVTAKLKSDPDREFIDKSAFKQMKMGIGYVFDDSTRNTELGAAVDVVRNNWGDAVVLSELFERGGYGWFRDGIERITSKDSNGNYTISDAQFKRIADMKRGNIGTYFIINSPNGYTIPETDAEIDEFKKYLRDHVSKNKDLVDVWEIWNEPNITNFNPRKASIETLVNNVYKNAYEIIKEIDPTSIVLGCATADIAVDYIETVFKAGGLKYMDGVSCHPYDWSGAFNSGAFVSYATRLKELLKEYGAEDKPVWGTEFGFSTYPEGATGYSTRKVGFSHREQAQLLTLETVHNKSFNLFDVMVQYTFMDFYERKTSMEGFWGLVESREKSYNITPYAIKPSFVAYSAFNHFLNQDAEAKERIIEEKEKIYALSFYNKRLDKDILYLQNNSGSNYTRTYNLGCNNVEVYDIFGNKIGNMKSQNGEFTFAVTPDPVYVLGDFTKFEKSDSLPTVSTEKIEHEAVAGDPVTIILKKYTSTKLNIEVLGAEPTENKGFVNNTAKIVMDTADIKESRSFKIKITDNDKNLYYISEHKIIIVPPVEISFDTQQVDEKNLNAWCILATITNQSQFNSISGSFELTAPEKLTEINRPRTFEIIKPGSSVTYSFNAPLMVNKRLLPLEYTLKLSNGYESTDSFNVDFTSARYAEKKPVIDGDVGDGEWIGSWIGASDFLDVNESDEGYKWHGPDDCSFNGLIMWDEDAFYFMGILRDNIHFNPADPEIPGNMWQGDSFQLGFDDRQTINIAERANFTEFGLAYLPGGGTKTWIWSSLYDWSLSSKEAQGVDAVVKRHTDYTVYEARIPWESIFKKDYKFNPDGRFGFSVLANDNDGNGRGMMEYAGGIGWPKDAVMFSNVKFIR